MSEVSRVIIRSMTTLLRNAVKIDGPIKVVVQPYSDVPAVEAVFDPSEDIEEVVNCYREIDGVIAFIHGESMYAVPACNRSRRILNDNGFKKDLFLHVPFTWGSSPVDEAEKWRGLRTWQKKQKAKDAQIPEQGIIHLQNLA